MWLVNDDSVGKYTMYVTFESLRLRMIKSEKGMCDTRVTMRPLRGSRVSPTFSGQYCSHFFFTASENKGVCRDKGV